VETKMDLWVSYKAGSVFITWITRLCRTVLSCVGLVANNLR
jgi:hypothetical protein